MSDEPQSFFRKFGRWVFTWVSVIASVATITGLWLQTRDGPPEISGIIDTQERLTTPSSENKLKVSYVFEGKEVKHLWRLRLTLRHEKGQTVIGTGPKQNVLGAYLPIKLSIPSEILALSIEKNDLGAVASAISPTEISLRFDQWRKGEVLTLVLYLETPTSEPITPTAFSSGRSIIDGKLTFQTTTEAASRTGRPLVDRLPAAVATTVRIFLTLMFIVFVFAGLHGVKTTARDYARQDLDWRWFSAFGEKAKQHLVTEIGEPALSMLEAEHFVVAPSTFVRITGKTRDEVWQKFSGPVPSKLSLLAGVKPPSTGAVIGSYAGFGTLLLVAAAIMSVTWVY